MRIEGTLKSWDDERGFGFIATAQGGQDIFVHIKDFPRGTARPQVNQALTFEVTLGQQGKKRAVNVQPIHVSRRPPLTERQARAQLGAATLLAIPVFLVVYGIVTILWRPPIWIMYIYAVASILTFIAYANDKSAAKNDTRRTPENRLHFFALACGWPGALLAQQFLRHKSTKVEFRQVFWLTVILNVIAFVVICSLQTTVLEIVKTILA